MLPVLGHIELLQIMIVKVNNKINKTCIINCSPNNSTNTTYYLVLIASQRELSSSSSNFAYKPITNATARTIESSTPNSNNS